MVQENESVYTKEEVHRAKQAYELVKNSGYPSPNEMLHLLQDGNIRGLPTLGSAVLERAYRIYGVHPEYGEKLKANRVYTETKPPLTHPETPASPTNRTHRPHLSKPHTKQTSTPPFSLKRQTRCIVEAEALASLRKTFKSKKCIQS